MPQELIVRSPSLKQALEIASKHYNAEVRDISYTILEQPRKNWLGKHRDGVFKIWKSSLLESVLNSKDDTSTISTHTDKEDIENILPISLQDITVIVKDNGIFVKLDPMITYTESILKQAFIKRGVLKELEPKILEILEKKPIEFTKLADFRGKKTDKSELILSFNNDYTQAYLSMKAPKKLGGPTCSFQEVLDFIKTQGIYYGIKFTAISALVQREILNTPLLIAQGKSAVAEHSEAYKKYYISEQIEIPKNQKLNIDFKNQITKYKSFKKGDLVCEKIGTSPFIAGVDVFGKTIDTASEKSSNNLIIGKNLKTSKDKQFIYADIDGFVLEKDGTLSMDSFLHIQEDIGYNTGNINVTGDILISGNVQVGFQVQSTGNITIEGFVQRGSIISDKNIFVKKGVIGGEIKAKGSFIAHYIDFSNVSVLGNVVCKQEVNNCIISSSGYVLVYGKKGAIIGGELIVKKGVMSFKIGSERRGINMLIGLEPRVLEIQKKLIEEEEKLTLDNKQIHVELEKLTKIRNKTQNSQQKEESFHNTLQENQTILERLAEQLIKIQEYFYKQKKEGFISFHGTLYPGVVLNLNGIDIPITEKINNKTIQIKDENITVLQNQTDKLEKKILDYYGL